MNTRPLIAAVGLLLMTACVQEAEPADVPVMEPTDEASAETPPVRRPVDVTGSWLKDGAVDSTPLAGWLRTGQYRVWTANSGVFPSAQGGSRVYVNDVLAGSLAIGNTSHPTGSIGVRELYDDDLVTPRAVNLTIKLADDDGSGEGWLWTELVDFAPGAGLSVDEPAAPRCVGCHSGRPDLVQVGWPLR